MGVVALSDETDVRELRDAVHEDDVRRLDVAVNQTVSMQMFESLAKSEAHLDALLNGKTLYARKGFSERARNIFFWIDSLARLEVVSSLHDVIEAMLLLIAANLQNIDKATVSPRDGLEFFDAGKFAVERRITIEGAAADYFHGAIRAHDVAGQPNFAVA